MNTLKRLELSNKEFEGSRMELLEMLEKLFHKVDSLPKYIEERDYDFIVSYGERLSCFLLTVVLNSRQQKAELVIGTEAIAATGDYGNAKCDMDRTPEKAKSRLQPLINNGIIPVVTGFFGESENGDPKIFGRGGSDYSASILAAALDAQELTVWKEVDGVYTSDPNTDKTAQFLPKITYERAAQMARAGAKVLHPETMEPVRDRHIPIRVRNTFRPQFRGTIISG